MDLFSLQTLQFGLAIVALLAALTIGYYTILHLRREMVEGDESVDHLAAFAEAYEAGEMDSAEYRRIRETLGDPTLPISRPPPIKGTAPPDDQKSR